jgi:hypothetical protein
MGDIIRKDVWAKVQGRAPLYDYPYEWPAGVIDFNARASVMWQRGWNDAQAKRPRALTNRHYNDGYDAGCRRVST